MTSLVIQPNRLIHRHGTIMARAFGSIVRRTTLNAERPKPSAQLLILRSSYARNGEYAQLDSPAPHRKPLLLLLGHNPWPFARFFPLPSCSVRQRNRTEMVERLEGIE